MKFLFSRLMAAASALALMATAASAEIVCNREGECWHVKDHVEYRPEWGLVVHPDNWKWAQNEHFKWREHEGRGYWRNGSWVAF